MFTVEVKKDWYSDWTLWGTFRTRDEANEKAMIALQDNVDVYIEEVK